MKLATLAVVTTSLGLSAPDAHAGACAMPQFGPEVLSPATGVQLDASGGVVVGLSAFRGGGRAVDNLGKLAWTFDGAAPVITMLAPGLAIVAPKQLPAAGATATLRDPADTTTPRATATAGAVAALPAPKVKALQHAFYSGPRSSGSSLGATLAAPPPASAVALLYYDPEAYKAGKPARGWIALKDQPAGATVQLYATGRCVVLVPGTDAPMVDDKVVLVWLDGNGHRSPASNAVVVTGK